MLYEIPQLNYVAPRTAEEAVHWLTKYGIKARVLGGGTDLQGLIKDRVTGPKFSMTELLVDIKKIPGIKGVIKDQGGLRIGAATTLTDLEESSIIQQEFPIIAHAASVVATLQIRNVGTIGGNLCQRP